MGRFILFLTILMIGFHFDVKAQEFSLSNFHYAPNICMPNEKIAKKNVQISEEIILPASILVNSKGNGLLKIANLSLHVYDTHDNTAFYKNGLLNIYFVDINGDSCKDLIIYGTNVITPEKGGEPLGMHPVIFIAIFCPETKNFRLVLSSPIFNGFTPISWKDYRFTHFSIPFLWTVYFSSVLIDF